MHPPCGVLCQRASNSHDREPIPSSKLAQLLDVPQLSRRRAPLRQGRRCRHTEQHRDRHA